MGDDVSWRQQQRLRGAGLPRDRRAQLVLRRHRVRLALSWGEERFGSGFLTVRLRRCKQRVSEVCWGGGNSSASNDGAAGSGSSCEGAQCEYAYECALGFTCGQRGGWLGCLEGCDYICQRSAGGVPAPRLLLLLAAAALAR